MAAAGLGVLTLVAGSAAGVAAMTSTDTRVVRATGPDVPAVGLPLPEVPQAPALLDVPEPRHTGRAEAEETTVDPLPSGEADRTATRTPRRKTPPHKHTAAGPKAGNGRPAAPAGPAVRVKRIFETEAVPFRTRLVRDPSLPRGTRKIRTPGVLGKRVLRYEVTYTGGRETSRRLLGSTVTRAPRHRVVAFGVRGDDGRYDDGDGRECHLNLGSCVDLGRGAVCVEDQDPTRPASIVDGDLSLLDPTDIDELQLTLPCEDDDAKDDGETKDSKVKDGGAKNSKVKNEDGKR